MSLNQVLMIGNAGADAEMRYTPNGDPVAEFNMAVSQNRQVNGEWQTINTEWFRVSTWGQQAERIANTIKRGNKVFVEGRLKSSPYRTEGGEIRAGLQISSYRVINLTQGGDDGGYGSYGGGGDNFRAVPQDGGGSAPASGAPAGAGAGAGAGAAAGGGQSGGSGGDYSDNFDEGEDLPW